MKKVLKGLVIAIAIPISLFLIASILLYIPGVQNFVVHKVTQKMSESGDMKVRIGRINLAFPLDLALNDFFATKGKDTLADARALRVGVQLLPLLKGKIEVDGITLVHAKINTSDLISDTKVKGYVGRLSLVAHGVDLRKERVLVDRTLLKNAHVQVILSDTAKKDTVKKPVYWKIDVRRLAILTSSVELRMPGDSMRVGAYFGKLEVDDGDVDLGLSSYRVKRLLLKNSAVRYDLPFCRPVKGFDYNHLNLSQLNLRVDTFSFNKGVIGAGISGIRFTEKSGLKLASLQGSFQLDSAGIRLPEMKLRTAHSTIDVLAFVKWDELRKGRTGDVDLRLHARIGRPDLLLFANGLSTDVQRMIPSFPLVADIDIRGGDDRLDVKKADIKMASVFRLKAEGKASHLMREQERRGDFRFSLYTENLNPLIDVMAKSGVNIPSGMTFTGNIALKGDTYSGRLNGKVQKGHFSLIGSYSDKMRRYRLDLKMKELPLQAFLPKDSLYDFTGSLNLSGQGFDPFVRGTSLKADIQVERFRYARWMIDSVRTEVSLHRGLGKLHFISHNKLLFGEGTVEARFTHKDVKANIYTNLEHINIQELSHGKDTVGLDIEIKTDIYADKALRSYGASGEIFDIGILTPRKRFPAKDVHFCLDNAKDSVSAHISAGDLTFRLNAGNDIQTVFGRLERFMSALSTQLKNRILDHEKLKRYLPDMDMYIASGANNPISRMLKFRGYDFNEFFFDTHTSPKVGINGNAHIYSLKSGSLLLDTIRMNIFQDSTGVQTYCMIHNVSKYNPDKFEAVIKSYIDSTGTGLEVKYNDLNKRQGIDVGVRASLVPGGIRVHFYPEEPVIAYRRFRLNPDNYIYLGRDKRIEADVQLLADDGTGLKVFTQPNDSVQDMTISVNHLNLGELTGLISYAPRIEGFLSGDFRAVRDKKEFSATANLEVKDMAYEGSPLGHVGLDAVYLPKGDGEHYLNAITSRNGSEIMSLNGIYNDKQNGAISAELALIHFPLDMLNGFMGDGLIKLSGYGEGSLNVTGKLSDPLLNGEMRLDSAGVKSAAYGMAFRIEDRAVKINDGKLALDNFSLYSSGKEPLVINGDLDLRNLNDVRMDITMKANNFELVNAKKTKESLVFGKVYADYRGALNGSVSNLTLKGMLNVLGNTNVTYILKDSPLTVNDQLSDLVTFVDFSDTTHVAVEKQSMMGMDITLAINVSDAARVHCFLSEDGNSYVNLEGGGDLMLKCAADGEMRLTGRYTVNSGEMKYELPVIPLKTFNLVNGSYVEFTGDITNPILNINAVERVRASVTENNVPRSVAFDVGVSITKPLNQMGLEFTLEAPEDLSVQNQLMAISREQRAKLAVSMLATGMYLMEGNSSGFDANNALNAFLQSEIQNIAGQALKSVDLSLSVEDGTSATGASQTDYSFRFAKRLWGNRVSIIVGGKVSTGNNAQNNAESFIDNVSVEYRLDKGATRYVRVFYDRNTQDPLEGQIIKAGAGLVLRRKTDSLGELFIFRNSKKKNEKNSQPVSK